MEKQLDAFDDNSGALVIQAQRVVDLATFKQVVEGSRVALSTVGVNAPIDPDNAVGEQVDTILKVIDNLNLPLEVADRYTLAHGVLAVSKTAA